MILCRSNYGDYFGITVAGYPEAHPEVITDDAEEMERAYQSDLQYLKKKVRKFQHFLLMYIAYTVLVHMQSTANSAN